MAAKTKRRTIRKTVRDVIAPTSLGISLALVPVMSGCDGTPDNPVGDAAADKATDARRDQQIYYVMMPPDAHLPDLGKTPTDADDEPPILYILPVMPDA